MIYNYIMENQINTRKSIPHSLIWIISTVVLCTVFIMISIPGVQAQTRQQDSTTHYISILRSVFDFIQRNYVKEVDPNVLFEGAMAGMLDSLEDPYSSFLFESEMADLTDTTSGSYGGIGLYISKPVSRDGRPTFVEVAAPIEDTPGWRAGINPGDLIIEINGEPTDFLTQDEVLARLKGPPGDILKLLIRRGEKLEFPVTVTRAIIEVPTTKHAMIGNIGYLNLLTFTPMTSERARDAINEFRSKGYSALILDLRNNHGGLLDSAVDVTNLFLEGGVVVTTKSRIPTSNHVYYARARAVVNQDIPMVVLINRGSASASEIVAGALKDRGRAYLVGEKTYGKGSVQQVYNLDRVGFKLTTALYYTPSDVNIDKIGIPPDLEVKFPEFTLAESEKLNELINANSIPEFVAANPNVTSARIETFAAQLSLQYGLDTTLLKRLIRNELNRTVIAPVYDLEYDVQLQEAVRILNMGNFRSLMQTTKTLKTLQDEAVRDEEFAKAS